MAALGALLAVSLLLHPSALCAQTNRIKPTAENRYLLIVETSRSMQRRADGAIHAVADLLASSMSGQLHRNDSLGVWTFNDDLHAGLFPLQHWTPEGKSVINAHVIKFLTEQKLEKSANLDRVFASLGAIARDSQALTVILITTGEGKIRGTPFDDVLNQGWAGWREQQQKAHMPVVTVLRAAAGKWVNYSLTAPPWQVEMPAWPAVAPVAAIVQPAAAKPKPKIELPTNWVETTAQSQPVQAPRTTVPPPTPRIEPPIQPKRDSATVAISHPAGWVLGPDSEDPLPAAKVAPRPRLIEPPLPPKPALTEPAVTTVRIVTNFTATSDSNAPDNEKLASMPFSAPPTTAKTRASAIEILKGPESKPPPPTVEPLKTSPPPVVVAKSAPAPQPAVVPPPAPGTTPVVTAPLVTTPAVAAALPAPRVPALAGNTFWIVAVIVLAGACVFLLATRRRPAPPAKVSLITRSMDAGQS